MKLHNLLKDIKIVEKWNYANIDIKSIHSDSREVKDQSLFIAIKGEKLDGNDFVEKAIENKAKVIVFEGKYKPKNNNIVFIKVKDSRESVSIIARNFYRNPSSKIKLVGVTGTNGKTTTATLLFNLTQKLGYKSSLISTIENKINKQSFESKNTTPDAISINKFLNESILKGCKFTFMECSSHAIDQKRIFGLKFSGAIFTNLTRDHLDYHKTMKKYALAKKTFFDSLDGKAFVIVNKDDKYSDFMVSNCKAKKYFFSIDKESNFKVKILEQNIKGIKIAIKNDILSSKLFGKYNIYNLTGIYLTSLLLKMPKNALIKEISKISPPKGRLEFVKLKNDIYGIVDYAHTPDAMLNVLKNIREIKNSDSKIITIFGCGGDRDKTKRPIMGQIAEKLSDEIIITSDNPRSEDPNSIIEEIYKGVKDKEVFKIEDRKKAIEKGISLARNGDIVMVLGKGHEKYQIYKDRTVYFSDIDVLKNNNG